MLSDLDVVSGRLVLCLVLGFGDAALRDRSRRRRRRFLLLHAVQRRRVLHLLVDLASLL